MFGKRKKSIDQAIFGTALELRAADGSLLASFAPELAQEYRRMLTGLSFRAELPRRIALVAALRGEGVTYTSLAVATTLANDMERNVCVVELNWWSPGMVDQISGQKSIRRKKKPPTATLLDGHPVLQSQGIAGVLRGTMTLDDALIGTSSAKLCLLPAGELPPAQRSSTARSPELGSVLSRLAERFDHLIFDIPAVRATSDAVALVTHSDAACVVVRQGVTPASQVRLALDELQHETMLGVILNRTRISTPGWIYNLLPQE